MRIETGINILVEMGDFNVNGTGYQGYLPKDVSYENVVRVFGDPKDNSESLDGKVKVLWIGKVNGLVFTVYDYKSRVSPEENTDWHIGGKIKMTGELVNIYFREMLKIRK